MNERERILDLVNKGVISSEEALVLLENLAKATGEQTSQAKPNEKKADSKATQQAAAAAADDALAALNTKLATARGQLDAATAQLTSISNTLAANEEQIIVLDTMEDLDTLTPEKYQERGRLKAANRELAAQKSILKATVAELKDQVAALERQKADLTRQSFTDRFFGDEWQDQAKDALADLGKTVGDAAGQVGALVKQTVSSVLDNVDWKDVTVKVPGIATAKFDHTFTYPASQASILDVKVANGDVTLETWDSPDIEIQATIKLYGKMAEDTPFDAFAARSRIEVNDDHLVFQIPNKRVQADLTIRLPKRTYDHTTVRLLNGSLTVNQLEGKDLYVKSTNGSLSFTGLNAVMLETEGVNGNIRVTDSQVHDLMLETVNGDIRVDGEAQTLNLQTVNGTIRTTLSRDFKALTASSVHGNFKLALPADVAVSGTLRTAFGSIKSRMSGVEVADQSKSVELDRPGVGTGTVKATTTSGVMQLKDTDSAAD